MTRLECFFDCSSPWTYLAFHNLPSIARAAGTDVRWRPILVGGVFNAVNPSVYESRRHPVPAKASYMRKNLDDWARLAGLHIVFPPSVFPVNSVRAMRGCLWLEPRGLLLPFARGVFEAYFGADRDVSDEAVLADICRSIGVDPTAFAAGVAEPAIKEALRANTEELIRRGGFGSPTIFVDGTDMYFGNDALPLVAASLARARTQ